MTYVTVSEADGVTVVSIDRPAVNAMDVELLEELVRTFEELGANPPRAVVLAGREGFFSAGVDLKAVPRYGPDELRRVVSGINRMVLSSYGLPCPVVAAITGHAVGGGIVLALCADHRVASSEGRYGLTEVKIGVGYPKAAIGVVRAELAPDAARRLALGSQLVEAGECLRAGAFDEERPSEEVMARAIAVAGEMSVFPTESYARTKLELRGEALEAMRIASESDPLLAALESGDPTPAED